MPALIRVGHKGADAIVPGNTLASFDAALAAGVDMIELDVLSERADGSGELYVVHDHRALRAGAAPTLSAALAHLSSEPFAGVRWQLDLKRRGYEGRVLEALDAVAGRSRCLLSTGEWPSLERLRALDPQVRIGWTIASPLAGVPAVAQLAGALRRPVLRRLARARLRAGAIDAVVARWPLVSRRLVEDVRGAGGELYVWTVDDARRIRRLAALGVTGVITNDPRLFAGLS
jgi:glycerophosphoryl diester phosphodiesterase